MLDRLAFVGFCCLLVGFLLGIGVAASCNVDYTRAGGLSLKFGSNKEQR